MRSSWKRTGRGSCGRPRRGSRRATRLGVEGLEGRRVLAVFTSGPFGWAAGFEAGPTGNPSTVGTDSTVQAMAIDGAGSMYVAGTFSGNVDFDPSNGTSALTAPLLSMYVAKYSAVGALQWVRGVSGATPDPGSLAVTAAGNVIVAGGYSGRIDLDPGVGEQWIQASGARDGFILGLSGAGARLWSRSFGSGDPAGSLEFAGVLADAGGDLFVAGTAAVHDPIDAISVTTKGFVRRLDAAGNDVWSKSFGSGEGGQAGAASLHRDGAGGIHVAGRYWDSIDLDPGPGVVMSPNAPNSGKFLVRLTAAGLYSRSVALPAAAGVRIQDATVAADGSLYVGGFFTGTIDLEMLLGPSARGVMITSAGLDDGFLAKLTSAGGFTWVRTFGSTGSDFVDRVATNVAGTVFVGGTFSAPLDFDAGPGAAVLQPVGTRDAFLLRLGAGGGFSTVRQFGADGAETTFEQAFGADSASFAVGPNGGVLWSGYSSGFALNVDPQGAGALLQRPPANGLPRVGGFFAKEVFAPGVFVPSGVMIDAVEFGATATGYALRVNGRVIQVKIGANNASASRPGNGWVALGARQVGPGYELLWRNTRNASYYAWVLDSTGVYRNGFDVTLEDVHELEVEYEADITGDGTIGAPDFVSSNLVVGSVEFGSTDLGYAFLEGERLVHVTGPKGHASEAYPGNGWSAFGARRSGPGYEVLWYHETLGFFAWTLDAFGRYTAGRGVGLLEICELESIYGRDITRDGSIGLPFVSANVTIGGVEFGSTSAGYALRENQRVIQVKDDGGFASPTRPGNGAVALGARRTGDAFDLLWVNTRDATYFGWTLDSSGTFRNRYDVTLPEVHRLETRLNVDITRDGTIGPIPFTASGATLGDVEVGSTLLGYAVRVNQARVLQVTFASGYASPLNQGTWVPVAARRKDAGYELFWKNQQSGGYFAWGLNAFGRHTGGRVVGLAEIQSLETLHGTDII
jgi:hypothetical protein